MYATAEKSQVNGKARHINKTAARAARQVQGDAEDAMSTIFGAVNAVRDDLEDLAHMAGQRVREVYDDAEETVSEFAGDVSTAVKKNPVQSSLIALGVGALIAMLIRR